MESGSGNRNVDTSRLVALAKRQHGVVGLWQLAAIGVSRWSVQRRAEAGFMHRVYRGVYALGDDRLTLRGRWMAVVLACGPDALLSHNAAAALWDLQRTRSGLIDVTSPNRHRHPGVRSHITRHPLQLIRATVDAIPVTSLERTVLDQAQGLSRQRLRTVLEQLQYRGLLHAERFDAHAGHRGRKAVADVMAEITDTPPWTQSELERRFLELIRSAGLPEPQTNVTVAGHVVDFFWPDQRLVVEVDGHAWHSSKSAVERDHRRGIELTLAGYRVIHVSYARIVYDSARLLAELRRLIGSAAA